MEEVSSKHIPPDSDKSHTYENEKITQETLTVSPSQIGLELHHMLGNSEWPRVIIRKVQIQPIRRGNIIPKARYRRHRPCSQRTRKKQQRINYHPDRRTLMSITRQNIQRMFSQPYWPRVKLQPIKNKVRDESSIKGNCRLCKEKTTADPIQRKNSSQQDHSNYIIYEEEPGEYTYQAKCSICTNFHDEEKCPDIIWKTIEVDRGHVIWSNIHATPYRQQGYTLPAHLEFIKTCAECRRTIK